MSTPHRDADETRHLLVTVEEAARRLSIGRSHIYVQMQFGRLRSVRIGRSRRILERDLDQFVEGLLGAREDLVADVGANTQRKSVKRVPLRSGRR